MIRNLNRSKSYATSAKGPVGSPISTMFETTSDIISRDIIGHTIQKADASGQVRATIISTNGRKASLTFEEIGHPSGD